MSQSPSTKHRFDLEDRTLAFAKRVASLCKTLRLDPVNREYIGQVVRASGSIGANYREANDALSKKDFAMRIRIARREAKEAHYWLQLVEAVNPDVGGEMHALLQESLELKKILSAIATKVSV